jgi:hypothetical protein
MRSRVIILEKTRYQLAQRYPNPEGVNIRVVLQNLVNENTFLDAVRYETGVSYEETKQIILNNLHTFSA